jgi:hypothetical protein
VWRGEHSITRNTLRMSSQVSDSWNKSDIELTKTRLGERHLAGRSSADSINSTSPVQRGPDWRIRANGLPVVGDFRLSRLRAAIRAA